MVATTTSAPVQTTVEGQSITLVFSREALGIGAQRELLDALASLNGVLSTSVSRRGNFLLEVISAEFFSVKEIARQAKALTENMLGVRQQSKVNVYLKPARNYDGYYSVLETDRRHEDTDLLDELEKQLGLEELGFSELGYNITFRGDDNAGLAEQMANVINDFYNGAVAQPTLDYVRKDAAGQSAFEWLFNRRFTNDEVVALISFIEAEVPGVNNIFFGNNGHRLYGATVNRLFPKNRTAYKVVAAVEDWLDQQAQQVPESLAKLEVDESASLRPLNGFREENNTSQRLGETALNGFRERL